MLDLVRQYRNDGQRVANKGWFVTTRTHGHPVIIIGAGRGGSALLELFKEERLVEVVAVVDCDPAATGMQLAREMGIPTYGNVTEALHACKDLRECIVYNLTHDDANSREVERFFGSKNVIGGIEAKLFWQMVTNLRQTQMELEKNQRQLQAVIHNAMDGIITINNRGEIQAFNPAAEDIFGYSQKEVLGKNVNILIPEPVRSQHDQYINRFLETGEGRIIGVRGREVVAKRKNGEIFPMELSASEMVLGSERYFIGIVRDITKRKLAEEKISYLAHHDYLTELPNRVLFMDRLEQALGMAKRYQYKEAIMFLDLDGFKSVNDDMGHDVGDIVLQEIAKRLLSLVRTSDTVARVGGDEFTIALNNVHEHEYAAAIAGNVVAELLKPIVVKGHVCRVGCSIGIAMFPDDAGDPVTLLKQADEAMYRSKQRGKNTFTFYSDLSVKEVHR